MPEQLEGLLRSAQSQRGQSLYDVSFESQILLAFMRHFGCMFCQEQVAELARIQRPLEVGGVRIAFVHMESEEAAQQFFDSYGLGDVHRFHDPDRALYNAFDLHRGKAGQIWGLPTLFQAAKLVLTGKAEFTRPTADVNQMPGVFLVHRAQIERAFRPQKISEKPDYEELADCTICDIDFTDEPE